VSFTASSSDDEGGADLSDSNTPPLSPGAGAQVCIPLFLSLPFSLPSSSLIPSPSYLTTTTTTTPLPHPRKDSR
jgi:hypothetical protein